MARNPACTVYVGNIDEKVSERVLYEILIQVGHVVDLHIPRAKDTDRHKGFAFAEYETEEIAQYAVKLFSGLVCLHNKTLKFAFSGKDKDKPSQNSGTPPTPQACLPPLANNRGPNLAKFPPLPNNSGPNLAKFPPLPNNNGPSPLSMHSQRRLPSPVYAHSMNGGVSNGAYPVSPLFYPQVSSPNGLSNGVRNSEYECSRHVIGTLMSVTRPAARQPVLYPSY